MYIYLLIFGVYYIFVREDNVNGTENKSEWIKDIIL